MRVHFVQFDGIDFGSLEDLNLLDGDVLKGIDESAGLFDVVGVSITEEVGDQVVNGGLGDLLVQNIEDLLSDFLNLGGLSI